MITVGVENRHDHRESRARTAIRSPRRVDTAPASRSAHQIDFAGALRACWVVTGVLDSGESSCNQRRDIVCGEVRADRSGCLSPLEETHRRWRATRRLDRESRPRRSKSVSASSARAHNCGRPSPSAVVSVRSTPRAGIVPITVPGPGCIHDRRHAVDDDPATDCRLWLITRWTPACAVPALLRWLTVQRLRFDSLTAYHHSRSVLRHWPCCNI